MLELRECLERVRQIANDHHERRQSCQKQYYDLGMREREFWKGNLVLVMLQNHPSKMIAKWQGPLRVYRKVGVLWTPAVQVFFTKVKATLCKTPVLYTPNFKQPFWLHTSTSAIALGAVLTQQVEEEEWPVTFSSWKLSEGETPYSTSE